MIGRKRAPLIVGLLLSLGFHAAIFPWLFGDFAPEDGTVTIEIANSPPPLKRAPKIQSPREKKPTTDTTASTAKEIQADAVAVPTIGAVSEDSGTTETSGADLGIRPHYPKVSRMLGEVGSVTIEAHGQNATTVVSSGFGRLDEAALKAVVYALQEGTLSEPAAPLRITFYFKLTSGE